MAGIDARAFTTASAQLTGAVLGPAYVLWVFAATAGLLSEGWYYRAVPQQYMFVAVITLLVARVAVGYVYTLVLYDACREHIARVALVRCSNGDSTQQGAGGSG